MILALHNVTRIRRTMSVGTDGRAYWSTVQTTIRANVQPAQDDEVQTLQEGERGRRTCSLRMPLTYDVRITTEGGPPADYVVVDGVTYEVRSLRTYPDLLRHIRAFCVEVQALNPPTGTH